MPGTAPGKALKTNGYSEDEPGSEFLGPRRACTHGRTLSESFLSIFASKKLPRPAADEDMFSLLAEIKAVPQAPAVPWDGEISYNQVVSEPQSANV